jgi:PAS domain S-box-containing protein
MRTLQLPMNEVERLREELASLKAEHESLKTMLEKIDTVFFSVDMQTGRVTHMSESCEKLYGFPASDFLKQPKLWYDVILDEDKPIIERNYAPMLEGKKIIHEHRIITSTGSVRWVETKITPTVDGNRKVVRIDGITNDITSRKEAEQRINQNQSRFEQLIEKSHDGIAMMDSNNKLLYISQSVKQILGYSIEELANADPQEYIHPDDHAEYISVMIRTMANPSATLSARYRIRNKSGEWRWIQSTITNLLGEPSVRAILFNYTDVTEQVQTSAQLESHRKNSDALINSTADLLWSFDAEGNLLMANKAFCDAMGYVTQAKIVPGISLTNLAFPQETLDKWKMLYGRVLSGESFIYENHEYYIEDVWGEISFNPLIEDGKVIGGACVWRDITEKKRRNAELQASQNSMAEAQRLTKLGSWELQLDENDVVIRESMKWSEEVYRVYGYRSTETPDFYEVTCRIAPEDLERVALWSAKIKAGSEDTTIEYRIITRSGQVRWVRCTANVIRSETPGGRSIMMGTIQDINDRKIMELESGKITNDLIERNKALEQFAHIVSHNLRSPVANILGLSHLINLTAQNEEDRRKCFEGLSLSARRLDEIIMDLNKILNVKRGILEDKETVNLNALIESIKESIGMMIDEEGVIIDSDFSEAESLFTVKNYMHSIFYNLISNSIKYKRPGIRPIISATSERVDGKIILTFRDNGSGIDMAKHKDNVFGLYKRFHLNSDGKGMGLFMIKTQVESLGGNISLNSEVNKGTTIRIELPAAE